MPRSLLPIAAFAGLGLACGPRTGAELDRQVQASTRMVEEGGATPLQAELSFKSPEAMAIQEVPYEEGKTAETRLWNAYQHYQRQWTMRLAIEPKASARVDPQHPLAMDIENNGGMWGDFARNLNRLMFEMGGFIRLKTADGKEWEPSLVEYQRSFGMGKARSFLLIFPKKGNGQAIAPPFEVVVKEFGQGMGTIRFQVKEAPTLMSWWRLKQVWKSAAKAEKESGKAND